MFFEDFWSPKNLFPKGFQVRVRGHSPRINTVFQSTGNSTYSITPNQGFVHRFSGIFERNHTFFARAYTGSSRPSPVPAGDGKPEARRKGYCMQLDKKSLDRLTRLNDDQLRAVIGKLLTEYGVDVSRVPLSTMDMSALRAVLQMAGAEDISRLLSSMGGQPR